MMLACERELLGGSYESDLLPASTAPPSPGHEVPLPSKRKRQGTVRYMEGREGRYTALVGLSQPEVGRQRGFASEVYSYTYIAGM
jgi:hypothetical protein